MTHPVSGHIRGGSPVRPYVRRNPGGSGGGPGTAVVAIGLAVVLGVGPPSSGLPPRAAEPEPPAKVAKEMRTKVNRATERLLRASIRWQRKGYQVTFDTQGSLDCAAHSYGKVHAYFAARNCVYLVRAYAAFRDKHGDALLVAVSIVDSQSGSAATHYKTLVDSGGTGNITELSRDVGRYRSVKYQGFGYDSGYVGAAGVWNVQVQPVPRRFKNPLVNAMAKEAVTAVIAS